MWVRAGINWDIFRPAFRNGTTATAIACAAIGGGVPGCGRGWPPARPAPATRSIPPPNAPPPPPITSPAPPARPRRKRPHATVNYVACHDGATLQDLVSYQGKNNLANGEDNRDGASDNLSANYGTEGETDDPAIIAYRERVKRSMLATLLTSLGT